MTIDNPAIAVDPNIESIINEIINSTRQQQISLIRKLLMTHTAPEIQQSAKHINNIGSIGTAVFNLMNSEEDYIQKYQPVIKDYFTSLNVFNFSTYRVLFKDIDKPLNDLFVPLKFESVDEGLEAQTTWTLQDVLRQNNENTIRLLLQGNPGSGKSTLLSYVALNAWKNPEKIGLSAPFSYIPLYVKLQNLAKINNPDLGKRLLYGMAMSEFQMINSMPENFFAEWPKFLGAKWLLLLDGYDEIDEKYRNSIDIFLSQLLEKNINVLITTRPTVSLTNKIREQLQEFIIDDFDEAQKNELAENLFPNEEEKNLFLSQLNINTHQSFSNTPLMITVSAIVFKNRKQHLPDSEIDLYHEYLENYLAEAYSRNENIYFDSLRLKSTVLKVLRKIAYEMTLDSDQDTIKELNKYYSKLTNNIADLIRAKVTGLDKDELLELAANYIRILGKSAGVFQCSGNVCSWLHPTFREYLAATHIIELAANSLFDIDSEESWFYFSKWNEDRWRRVIFFLLLKWSKDNNVNQVVKRMISEASGVNDRTYCLCVLFIGNALVSQARVDEETRRYVYEHLIGIVESKKSENYCNRLLKHRDDVHGESAAELIRKLSDDSLMQKLLTELAQRMISYARNLRQEGSLALAVSTSVFFDLSKLGQLESLLDMAKDETLDDDVRIAALYTLNREKWWYNGVVDKTIASNAAEFRMAKTCSDFLIEEKDTIIESLLSVLRNTYGNEKRSEMTVRLLEEYGGPSILTDILKNDDYDLEGVKLHVLESLDEAENLKLANDEAAHIWVRIMAVLAAFEMVARNWKYEDETIVQANKNRLEEKLMPLLELYRKELDKNETLATLPPSLKEKLIGIFGQCRIEFLVQLVRNIEIPFLIKEVALNCTHTLSTDFEILQAEDVDQKCKRIIAYKLANEMYPGSDEQGKEYFQILLGFLQKEVSSDPDNFKMQLSLAKMLNRVEDREGARKALSKVTAILPDLSFAFHLSGLVEKADYYYDKSLQQFDKAVQLDPEDDYSILEKADVLMSMKCYDEVISLFESNAHLTYSYPQYRWIYINCLFQLKNYEKAVSESDRCLNYEQDATLFALRAKSKSAIKHTSELEDAVEDTNQALLLSEHYHYGRYQRFLLCRRLGFLDAALSDALEYSKEHFGGDGFEIKSMVVLLYLRMKKFNEAQTLFAEYEDIDYRSSPFHLYLEAVMCFMHQRKQEGNEVLREAREVCIRERDIESVLEDPYTSDISNLVLIDTMLGNLEEAKKCLNCLIEKNERYHLANYTIPFLEDQVELFQNKNALTLKDLAEKSLFPNWNTTSEVDEVAESDPDKLYNPQLPRAPYPLPMYCQLANIQGLHDESIWAKKILQQYKKSYPASKERLIVLFNIKDPNQRDAVYGYCNFKQDKEADFDLKFSEKEETMIKENMRIFVQGYGVEILLFTHTDLAQKFKQEIDRIGLIVKCLLIKFTTR
jgi:hypothetical protein